MESISQERHSYMLDKIQRRATKFIPGLRDLRYEERQGMWTDNIRNTKIKGRSNINV